MGFYDLVLKWDRIRYVNESLAVLEGAKFIGEVLNKSYKLNDVDEINIDITKQFLIIIPDFYIFKFKWSGVTYFSEEVWFEKAWFENFKTRLFRFKDDDYLIIDTSKHEEESHPYFMNYEATLYNRDGEVYRLNG